MTRLIKMLFGAIANCCRQKPQQQRDNFTADVIDELIEHHQLSHVSAYRLTKRYPDVITAELRDGDVITAATALMLCQTEDACSQRSTSRPHMMSSLSRSSDRSTPTPPNS